MILPIVTFGNAVLKQPAEPVAEVTPAIRKLVQDMLETMYDAEGVGLAAEQVGHRESICVIDVPRDAEYKTHIGRNDHVAMPLVLINPVVRDPQGSMRKSEGCLSFPGLYCDITRAETVTVLNRVSRHAKKTGLRRVFADLPEDHWAFDEIMNVVR